jgi:16S rRNA (uracil1498-N3)-methyltransferase
LTAAHFFAPSVEESSVVLTGEDARHAVRVLRIRPGETVTVADGAGALVSSRVLSAGDVVVAEVIERHMVDRPVPAISVWQAIPKAGKLETVVQKLTELGVMEIVPVRTSRSVARWNATAAARNVERLRAVAREAAKQSRRAWLPVVADVHTVDDVPAGALVLHEGAGENLLRSLPEKAPSTLALVVGPEGGFDEREVAELTTRGCRPVSLGEQILRTETAALAAVVVALSRYGAIG